MQLIMNLIRKRFLSNNYIIYYGDEACTKCEDILVPCELGDFPMLVHDILIYTK